MTDFVTATAGETVVPPAYQLPPTGVREPTSDLDKDQFLQLLVAQLKHQDPLEPTSSDDFIATSAQFTVVEKLDELAQQGENSALINSLATAASLFGREVVATSGDGQMTAIVERSQIAGSQVNLVTDRGPIPLESVIEVGPAPTEPSFSATAPAAVSSPPAPAPSDSPTGSSSSSGDAQ